MDLSHLVYTTRIVQDPLRNRGLSCINMCNDAYVPDPLELLF